MPDELWQVPPMATQLRNVVGRLVGAVLVSFVGLAAATGCSDDEESKSADAAGGCQDMCTKTGFSTSRVDVQPNETNCFCTGNGTVTGQACTDMCKAIGKPGGEPFGSGSAGANACQCQ